MPALLRPQAKTTDVIDLDESLEARVDGILQEIASLKPQIDEFLGIGEEITEVLQGTRIYISNLDPSLLEEHIRVQENLLELQDYFIDLQNCMLRLQSRYLVLLERLQRIKNFIIQQMKSDSGLFHRPRYEHLLAAIVSCR